MRCAGNHSCTSCDWAGHGLQGAHCKWDSTCYFRSDGLWLPHANGRCNHTAGRPHVPSPPPPACGAHVCADDSDCSSFANCTWCRDDVPGKKNPMMCGGPPGDSDCGTLPSPPRDPEMVQYMCMGDSVSKGIYPQLSRLAPQWESFHPSSNEGGGCGNTVRGKDCTPLWLRGATAAALHRKWDIVTFNYGLHDLAQDGERQTIAQYRRNLANITATLRGAGGSPRLFWISSTPVPDVPLGPPRNQSDVPLYNAAAADVMTEFDVPIIDLYSFALRHCGNNSHYTSCPGFQKPGNVHFEKAGYAAMASFIYSAIKNASAEPATQAAPL
eukprot:COSAG01_NODE_5138_length_4460_cov_2.442559_2_plen_327_part_00